MKHIPWHISEFQTVEFTKRRPRIFAAADFTKAEFSAEPATPFLLRRYFIELEVS
jgi:hypothetical protein